MTKKTNKAPQPEPNKGQSRSPVAWVNVSLSDDMVPAIQEQFADDYQTAGALLALCSFAHNVFVKYDPGTASYCAGLIAPDDEDGDKLKGVSGWSDNPLDAVRALLFKWYVLLGGVWPEAENAPRGHFR